jgi:hypothetical protein
MLPGENRIEDQVVFNLQPIVQPMLLSIAQNGTAGSLNESLIITPLAKECLAEIQKTQLGAAHTIKKLTATIGAGALTLSLPLAALYWMIHNHHSLTANPSAMLDLITSRPALLTAATAIATNELSRRAFSYNPAKELVRFSGNLACNLITFCVGAAAFATYRSYAKIEEQVESKHAKLHKKAIADLKERYQAAALDLSRRFKEAQNSPDQMFALQTIAETVALQLPAIEAAFHQHEISRPETREILSLFERTVSAIKDFKLGFKDFKSPQDNAYNAHLFLILPPEALKSLAVSDQALFHLNMASHYKLDWRHTAKGYLSATGNGLSKLFNGTVALPTLIALGAYLAKQCQQPQLYDFALQHLIQPIEEGMQGRPNPRALAAPITLGVLTAGTALYFANKAFQQTLALSRNERQKHDSLVASYQRQGTQQLMALYNGIAAKLKSVAAEKKVDMIQKELQEKLHTVSAGIHHDPRIKTPKLITNALSNAIA